ncbi:MAG: shikimate kinase [Candidatus Omnitrophica bacterium]|nr:shikimate kinase [Candidatus Omnitrophota bacterium]
MNITLIGFMGTGKSSVGRRLAKQLGWQFVDVDAVIEAMAAKPIPAIFAEHGEAVFRRLEKRAIRRAIRQDNHVIATGGGAFLDPENRRLLRAIGPVICLSASPKAVLERVRPTLARRPLLSQGSPVARIQALLAQRGPSYAKADATIDTTDASIEEVTERIWAMLAPWTSKSWQCLVKHCSKLSQRYGGKYIAVVDDQVVAVGSTHLEAYQAIRRPLPASSEVGIYYVPTSEEPAMALAAA